MKCNAIKIQKLNINSNLAMLKLYDPNRIVHILHILQELLINLYQLI